MNPVVHVFFGDAAHHPIIQNYLRHQEVRHHYILEYGTRRWKILRFFTLAWAILTLRWRQSGAILHAHDFVSASLAAVFWRQSFIFDSHEIYSCLAQGVVARGVVDRVERIAARAAAVVIYPSEERRDYYVGLKRERVEIVENLYDPGTGSVSDCDASQYRDFAAVVEAVSGRRFVYAGNTTPVRALAEIVSVFSRSEFAGDHLFIGGPLTQSMESVLASAGQNVTYLGQIPHQLMTKLLDLFDAGFAIYKPVDANNRLAAPTKIFEYAYHGLSVIANRSPYVVRLAGRMPDGDLITIDEIDVDSIATACALVRRRTNRGILGPTLGIVWAEQLDKIETIYRHVAPVVATERPAH